MIETIAAKRRVSNSIASKTLYYCTLLRLDVLAKLRSAGDARKRIDSGAASMLSDTKQPIGVMIYFTNTTGSIADLRSTKQAHDGQHDTQRKRTTILL